MTTNETNRTNETNEQSDVGRRSAVGGSDVARV